ncbi:MAG: long-chain fatty acid--CoA ligase, partial [Rectinema sp.]
VINGSPFVAESLVYDDGGELTALVYLKSEVLEGLEARVRDSLEEAGDAASKIGQAITGVEKVAVEKIGQAMSDVEKMISATLEKIRKEANERLASFSRIRKVKIQKEPFEKTPTQKIKRFLYPKETQKI